MKELVEVMAKSLVSNPSEVVVEEETSGTTTVLRLHVASEDMGKVIGKQGRIGSRSHISCRRFTFLPRCGRSIK